MRKTIALILAAFLISAGGGVMADELKFGWVDLEQVFRGYYKTEKTLDSLEEEIKQKEAEVKKLVEEIRQMEAAKELMREDERLKQEKEIVKKKLAANTLRQKAERELGQQIIIEKGKLLEEIIEKIEELARRESYTFIFRGELPEIVLYKDPSLDLTNRVLKEVNKESGKIEK